MREKTGGREGDVELTSLRARMRFVFATSPRMDVSRGVSSVAEVESGDDTEDDEMEGGGGGAGETMMTVEMERATSFLFFALDSNLSPPQVHSLFASSKHSQCSSFIPTLSSLSLEVSLPQEMPMAVSSIACLPPSPPSQSPASSSRQCTLTSTSFFGIPSRPSCSSAEG